MTEWVDWPRAPQSCGTRVTSVIQAPRDWKSREDYVYIGMPGYAGQTEGPFGKPWACRNDPRGWRAAYREYLHDRLLADLAFREAVKQLHGKHLVCFCKGGKRGEDADCHGDLLAVAAEWLHHRSRA